VAFSDPFQDPLKDQVQILSFFKLREEQVGVWLVLGFETSLLLAKDNKK